MQQALRESAAGVTVDEARGHKRRLDEEEEEEYVDEGEMEELGEKEAKLAKRRA
jgi:hypothetical protein